MSAITEGSGNGEAWADTGNIVDELQEARAQDRRKTLIAERDTWRNLSEEYMSGDIPYLSEAQFTPDELEQLEREAQQYVNEKKLPGLNNNERKLLHQRFIDARARIIGIQSARYELDRAATRLREIDEELTRIDRGEIVENVQEVSQEDLERQAKILAHDLVNTKLDILVLEEEIQNKGEGASRQAERALEQCYARRDEAKIRLAIGAQRAKGNAGPFGETAYHTASTEIDALHEMMGEIKEDGGRIHAAGKLIKELDIDFWREGYQERRLAQKSQEEIAREKQIVPTPEEHRLADLKQLVETDLEIAAEDNLRKHASNIKLREQGKARLKELHAMRSNITAVLGGVEQASHEQTLDLLKGQIRILREMMSSLDQKSARFNDASKLLGRLNVNALKEEGHIARINKPIVKKIGDTDVHGKSQNGVFNKEDARQVFGRID